ncbi:MAG: response regulator transcription factor [Gammaproteobacteria bacterium]|jgi:two-component system nitrate/nitrite response regulator NarL
MKILIADDHGLFRDSMAVWLQRSGNNPRIEFAHDWDSLCAQLPDGVDLILVDLSMPGMEGAISIERLHAVVPTTPLLVVSANEHPQVIEACLRAGASGYVTKASPGEEILRAVRTIMRGDRYRPLSVINRRTKDLLATLSDRQREVLAHLACGNSNRVIAETLSLTEGTVKQYVSQLLDLLNVDNRTQAGILARELLGFDPPRS